MPTFYLGQQAITTLYQGEKALRYNEVIGALEAAYTTTTTTTTSEPT